MIRIVYYVHGTTYDNASKKCSGWKDVLLNDLGEEQAVNLGKNTPYKFDILYTSDLTRAKTSAALAFPDFTSIEDSRLRECNYGDYDGLSKELVKYDEHIIVPFPNGESLKDVENRIRSFIEDIKTKHDGKTVGIIAHRAPQLALDVILNNMTWEDAIKNDWRKTGDWQPGWEYEIKD